MAEEEGVVVLQEMETNPLLSDSEEAKVEVFAATSMSNHLPEPENEAPGTSASAVTNGHRNSLSSKSRTTGSPSDEPEDQDQIDECSNLTHPDPADLAINKEPKSGEYKKIMELLKEAESSADPEYETKKRNMEFLTKFNPRGGPETRLSAVDYCCNLFLCCAICFDG